MLPKEVIVVNFSIHVDTETAKKLDQLTKKTGKPRNALINKAIRLFLDYQSRQEWPPEVRKLAGCDPKLSPFESHRQELGLAKEDPLA